ncbi:NAD(P)/FAD-dependent oxidoreductase [Paenibacillus polymyxa]|uniref:flavin-containing monooxygenase n=1 Tax=Paenibacillus polymyxa TaxID=1406 RepID=UPI001BE842F4|nr:FAD-dependent oxidoreductase [Paenibacillus polymyxa]MBT2282508.1 NAD(P)/FAD-dependent oxidoreductase [Paenibacillus polymyxa]
MEPIWDVIVIGGGQAGLASGYHLKKRGLSFLILEAGGEAAGAWPQYYDNLKLFSPAMYSSLPGLPIESPGDRYPHRDEVIQYLKDYASHFELPLVYHRRVNQISKESGIFRVTTSSGEKYMARNLISATGSFSQPYTPSIPKQEQFKGTILHSATYRTPAPFQNQSVIVVGRGNSAVQIAMELSEVAETTLAVREPVALIPQRLLGQDIHFWFKLTGIDSFWRFGKSFANGSSVLDLDGYKQRLQAGNPRQKKMFTAFYDNGVIWSDGTQEEVQTIIFATGYRSNVSYIDALGGLDGQGEPEQKNGISRKVTGLYYVGLSGQRSFASATLRGVGPDAEYVVKHIQNNLEKQKHIR